MATLQRPLIQKLNVGELAPELRGFIGFERYASGCRKLENMLPLAQGPATRRPGTRFLAEVKDSTLRTGLLPFEFNEEQAYAIEVGGGYLRFYKDKGRIVTGSGVPYEISAPYVSADLFSDTGIFRLHSTQSSDTMTLVHASYAPRSLTRTGHTAWAIAKVVFVDGPYLDENTTATTLTMSAAGAGVRTVTASAATGINKDQGFLTTDVGRLVRIGQRVTPWNGGAAYAVGDIVGGQGVSRVYQCISAGTSASAGGPTGTTDAIADGSVTWKYIGEGGIWWTYGLITNWNSATSVDVDFERDALAATGSSMWQLGVWSDTTGWPVATGFHGGRQLYGGPRDRPQRFDGSKIADFTNYMPGVLEDDPIAYNMDSNKVNAIRWFASQRDLLIGTSGGEARVGPNNTQTGVGPLNIDVKFQTKHGSESVAPIEGANAVLFIENFGRAIRELAFTIEADGYRAPDLTELASHLADERFVGCCFQPVPWSTVWVIREDGLLCSLTYDRDQGVIAWARHPMNGGLDRVEALCAIPGSDTAGDATGFHQVFMIVNRLINGQRKRYVEVLEDPFTTTTAAEDAWFLDSAIQYAGTPTSSVGGLEHLIGESVGIWADGGEHPDRTVSATGTVELDGEYSKVLVGRKVAWKVIPMPPDIPTEQGTGAGSKRKQIGARVLFLRSLGANFGPEDEELPIAFRDGLDDLGEAPALFSGWKDCDFANGKHNRDGEFSLTGNNGAPVTVAAVSPLVKVVT